MVFQELGGKLQGVVTPVLAQVAFRKEHRRLGAVVLAEVLGIGDFLEGGDGFGTPAVANHGLGPGNIVLGENRTRKRTH